MNNKHIQYLVYTGGVFLVLMSVVALVGITVMVRGNQDLEYTTISVSGSGKIEVTPNIATFSFTVQETSNDADNGQKIVSEKVSKILAGIKGLEVDKKDIKTESYSIYPKYEWLRVKNPQEIVAADDMVYIPDQQQKQVQTGFDINQNISIKVRDFTKTPEILTLLTETGVQNLSGPNFEVENPAEGENKARSMAIKEAQDNASVLAKDLGVRLGKIVSFSEDNGGYPQLYMAKSVLMDSSTESYRPELPTGQNTINKDVTITYKIK